MRVLDGEESSVSPWQGVPGKRQGDRASASLVNLFHPDLYENLNIPVGKRRMPGFVITSSAAAQERIVCSYYKDGATLAKQCSHTDPECRPGCANNWCENGLRWNCDYQPWRLKEMMERQDKETPRGHISLWGYNEVILDTWRKPWAMPGMVEAVFIQAGSTQVEADYGRQVHAKFLTEFELGADEAPLLEYDAADAEAPFRPMR